MTISFASRVQDWAACRERVAGAAGGGRYYDAVGPVGREQHTVDPGLHVQQPRRRAPSDHHVVEGVQLYAVAGAVCLLQGRLEHHATLDAGRAVQIFGNSLGCLLDGKLCDEAHAAHVDSEDGDFVPGDPPGDPQNGAVAACRYDDRRPLEPLKVQVDVRRSRHPRPVPQSELVDQRINESRCPGDHGVVGETDQILRGGCRHCSIRNVALGWPLQQNGDGRAGELYQWSRVEAEHEDSSRRHGERRAYGQGWCNGSLVRRGGQHHDFHDSQVVVG